MVEDQQRTTTKTISLSFTVDIREIYDRKDMEKV